MKLIIGIPIYITDPLHIDFTRQTLESINTSHDKQIFIVSNYVKPEFQEEVDKLIKEFHAVNYVNEKNSVSAAWNRAIDAAVLQNVDYILLPNNDIVFHPDCIDNLIKFAEEHQDGILWTANTHDNLRTLKTAEMNDSFDEHPHFSCFMMSLKGVEKLQEIEKDTKEPMPGYFDEGFEAAYFEDNDMHNRILRAKLKAYKTASALFYHYGSRTIKVDEDLYLKNNVTYNKNRDYFKSKWGFDPHGSAVENDDPIRFKFKEPFYGVEK